MSQYALRGYTMELHTKVLPPETLIPELLEVLKQADSVPLIITGGSMMPFLVNGRDTVYLSKAEEPLKPGDMVLYRRTSGQYVLHRIVKIENDNYSMVGDAQSEVEPGIRREQILARVSAVRRKGKLLASGSFWWDFFEKIWIHMTPVRPALIRICWSLTGKGRKRI